MAGLGWHQGITVFAALIALTASAASSAAADEASSPPGGRIISHEQSAMQFGGYDRNVAAANGFDVVTDGDGREVSVPVTEAARRSVAPDARGYGTVTGPCGTSWIDIKRSAITSMATVTTGFSVRLPTANRRWSVNLYSGAEIASFNFSDLLHGSGASWSSTQQRSYGSGGFGNVVPGSSVTLTDGTICFSGSPGTNF